jgi:hypothetical protein
MRRVLASAALAATAAATLFTATPAQANTCSNEKGDVYVDPIVGIDMPGDNHWYAICVLGGVYGVAVAEGPGGSTCIEVVVNSRLIGGC